MANEQISPGDVVQLKSGGPLMTVAEVGEPAYGGPERAWCDWFLQDKAPWKKEKGDFPLTSLKKVE